MIKLAADQEELECALLAINRVKAAEIFERCYEEDHDFEILERLVVNVLEKIGHQWEHGEIALSQVYMSGVICEELIDRYLPRFELSYQHVPRIAIGVLLDYHALGKRIVTSVLRARGFEIIDFGHGLSVDELVIKTLAEKIEILMISTLMLPSALKVKRVIEKLREQGSAVKVVVGGAPFRLDEQLWQMVQADAVGKNGTDAIGIIESLMRGGETP